MGFYTAGRQLIPMSRTNLHEKNLYLELKDKGKVRISRTAVSAIFRHSVLYQGLYSEYCS